MRAVTTIDTKSRVSISHWGMFKIASPRIFVPKGFKVADDDRTEWLRPDGYIEIVRDDE